MVRSQYAGSITPPAPTLATGSGTTTIASTGTYTVWLYSRCRGGITLFSPSAQAAIAPNQSLQITIPSSIRASASDIREVGIVASLDINPINGCVVATYPGYLPDNITPTTLPATITLSTDAHFQLRVQVATSSALPTSKVDGMRRYVEDINTFLEWNASTSAWRQIEPQTFNPYITNTAMQGGCDVDLTSIVDTSIILFPDYPADGSLSEPVIYWIVNDTTSAISQGKRVRVSASTNPADAGADDFKGLLQLTFLGYANLTTGTLDTNGMVTGGTFTYQGDAVTNLTLQKDLPANSAYVLQVQAQFDQVDTGSSVQQGAVLQVYPYLAANYSEYDPAADLLGSYIISWGEMRRILPDGAGLALIAGTGSGSVAYYKFRQLGRQIVPGIQTNTANQKIIITNNGTCFAANTVPSDTAALRAIVGTINGVGSATAWSNSISLSATTTISLTITHPINIRPDYPDVIASSVATLNASAVRVYVQPSTGGTIQVFDMLISGDSPETINLSATPTTTITSLPTVDDSFGLFTPVSFTPTTISIGSSSFTSGDYKVALAYLYNTTTTSISHDSTLGCIYEASEALSQVFESAKAVGASVANLNALRALPLSSVYPWQLRFVISEQCSYRADPTSYMNDNGASVIQLTATPSGAPLRFTRERSPSWFDTSSVTLANNLPPSTLGLIGDYCVDVVASSSTAGTVWTKTNATTWSVAGNIRGATPTLATGNVISLPAGANPTANVRTGSNNNYFLDFGLPSGGGSGGGSGLDYAGIFSSILPYSPGQIVRDSLGNLWLSKSYVTPINAYTLVCLRNSDSAGKGIQFLAPSYGTSYTFLIISSTLNTGTGSVGIYSWNQTPNANSTGASFLIQIATSNTFTFTPSSNAQYLTFRQKDPANLVNGQAFWNTNYSLLLGVNITLVGFSDS